MQVFCFSTGYKAMVVLFMRTHQFNGTFQVQICLRNRLAAAGFTFLFSVFLVDVLLKAVGDTPIMKTRKWAIDRGRTVQSLAQFISRFLKFDANEQLVSMVWLNIFSKYVGVILRLYLCFVKSL